MEELADKIRQGDRRSLARAMSLVDETGREAQALKDWLRRSTGQVPWWGFTGPPGVGKSTLIDALLSMMRASGRRVGVVAVDPTSPMSDGALLGDRVRMMRHAVDEDIFIRSLATRHREGGLSDATLHCARLLEVAGYDPVLIETVGVGQSEVDIASVADICVVMLGPGYGDSIQLIKAGLLAIADIVAVNKCDIPEANRLLTEVREQLRPLAADGDAGRNDRLEAPSTPRQSDCTASPVEIIGIEAKSGSGVDALLERLLEMDAVARAPQQRQHHRRCRVLAEIKRCAALVHERALERALAAPATIELVSGLERGELSMESVIAKLGVATVGDPQPEAGDARDQADRAD